MDLQITDRSAVVLGASQGLGFACAAALASEGATVTIAARASDRLNQSAKQIGAGAQAVDLSDANAVDAFAKQLGSLSPDIFVANSGGPPPGTVPGIADEQWDQYFDIMVRRQIQMIEAVLPGMRQRGWGRIAIIASSGIQIPIPHLAISNTLRSALAAYAKTLAGEVAKDGVTVNLFLPGRIATTRLGQLDEAAAQRQGLDIETVQQRSRATIPAGRYGRPEEFGQTVAFYMSEQASYLTGNQVRIDGGLIKAL